MNSSAKAVSSESLLTVASEAVEKGREDKMRNSADPSLSGGFSFGSVEDLNASGHSLSFGGVGTTITSLATTINNRTALPILTKNPFTESDDGLDNAELVPDLTGLPPRPSTVKKPMTLVGGGCGAPTASSGATASQPIMIELHGGHLRNQPPSNLVMHCDDDLLNSEDYFDGELSPNLLEDGDDKFKGRRSISLELLHQVRNMKLKANVVRREIYSFFGVNYFQ